MPRQSRTIPSRDYDAGTYTVDLPKSAAKKYTSMGVTLTREDWPGQGQIGVLAASDATVLTLMTGQGALFPTSGGRLRLRNTAGGGVELLQLMARSGDNLTVARGQENTEPLVVTVGADLRLFDLILMRFEASIDDGQSWQTDGEGTIGGGVIIDPRTGQPAPSSGMSFAFTINDGQPVPRDGDLRLVATLRVALRTSITVVFDEP
jgi:hypothetical protein